ncbi:MAG: hypothetical protein ACI9VR_003559 [Cognaticolwellia sp.]|jgi:hypothetical protein
MVFNGEARVYEGFKVDRWESVRQVWFWRDTLHIRLAADPSTEFAIQLD